MKRTAKAELRGKSAADLTKQANELREVIFRGRLAGAVEGKTLGAKARQMRRQIARIQTILTEKQPKAVKAKA